MLKKKESMKAKATTWQMLKNREFLLSSVTISLIFFVVAALQYWITKYLIVVLGVDTNIVFAYFSFACITGPVGGMIMGGLVTSKLGGFNSKKTIYTSLVMLAFACLASTPMPYINTFWIFAIDMWLTLFVGAFAVPVLTGMMLDAVAERDRT